MRNNANNHTDQVRESPTLEQDCTVPGWGGTLTQYYFYNYYPFVKLHCNVTMMDDKRKFEDNHLSKNTVTKSQAYHETLNFQIC